MCGEPYEVAVSRIRVVLKIREVVPSEHLDTRA